MLAGVINCFYSANDTHKSGSERKRIKLMTLYLEDKTYSLTVVVQTARSVFRTEMTFLLYFRELIRDKIYQIYQICIKTVYIDTMIIHKLRILFKQIDQCRNTTTLDGLN